MRSECAQKPIGGSRQQCNRRPARFLEHSHEQRPPANIAGVRDPCERGCPTKTYGTSQHTVTAEPASALSSSKSAAPAATFRQRTGISIGARSISRPLFASSNSWSMNCRRRVGSAAVSREASLDSARPETQIDIDSRARDVRRSTWGLLLDTSMQSARGNVVARRDDGRDTAHIVRASLAPFPSGIGAAFVVLSPRECIRSGRIPSLLGSGQSSARIGPRCYNRVDKNSWRPHTESSFASGAGFDRTAGLLVRRLKREAEYVVA